MIYQLGLPLRRQVLFFTQNCIILIRSCTDVLFANGFCKLCPFVSVLGKIISHCGIYASAHSVPYLHFLHFGKEIQLLFIFVFVNNDRGQCSQFTPCHKITPDKAMNMRLSDIQIFCKNFPRAAKAIVFCKNLVYN